MKKYLKEPRSEALHPNVHHFLKKRDISDYLQFMGRVLKTKVVDSVAVIVTQIFANETYGPAAHPLKKIYVRVRNLHEIEGLPNEKRDEVLEDIKKDLGLLRPMFKDTENPSGFVDVDEHLRQMFVDAGGELKTTD